MKEFLVGTMKWSSEYNKNISNKLINSIEKSHCISGYDTALAYGDGEAEKSIGNTEKFVITKIPGIKRPQKNDRLEVLYNEEYIETCIEQSIKNLGKIDVILLHNWLDDYCLEEIQKIDNWLNKIKKKYKVGVGIALSTRNKDYMPIMALKNCDYIEYSIKDNLQIIKNLNQQNKKYIARDLLYNGAENLLINMIKCADFAYIYILGVNDNEQLKYYEDNILKFKKLIDIISRTKLIERNKGKQFDEIVATKLKYSNLDSLDLVTLVVELIDGLNLIIEDIDIFECTILELISYE